MRPTTSVISVKQDRTGLPSSNTVQARHWPLPHLRAAARFAGERFKARRQLFARGGASVNHNLIAEEAFLFRGDRPVAERRNIWINQTLLIHAPGGWMIGISRMIEHGDAKDRVAKWALDVTPRGPLLLAIAAAQPVCIEVSLARIRFVP